MRCGWAGTYDVGVRVPRHVSDHHLAQLVGQGQLLRRIGDDKGLQHSGAFFPERLAVEVLAVQWLEGSEVRMERLLQERGSHVVDVLERAGGRGHDRRR